MDRRRLRDPQPHSPPQSTSAQIRARLQTHRMWTQIRRALPRPNTHKATSRRDEVQSRTPPDRPSRRYASPARTAQGPAKRRTAQGRSALGRRRLAIRKRNRPRPQPPNRLEPMEEAAHRRRSPRRPVTRRQTHSRDRSNAPGSHRPSHDGNHGLVQQRHGPPVLPRRCLHPHRHRQQGGRSGPGGGGGNRRSLRSLLPNPRQQ
jgi:hypothetical protein